MSEPTASEILARGPKYMGALWLDYRLHWDWKAKRDLRILAAAGVSADRAADILGRPPKSLAERCRTDKISLPPAWAKLIQPARKSSPRWAPLAYPYINFRRVENETLLLVNEMVARAMPGREDVCQDIMLAILERGLTPDRATVNEFIRKFRRENYEANGYAASLDEMIGTLSEADSIWNRI